MKIRGGERDCGACARAPVASRGQLSIEALVCVALMLALVLLFLKAEQGLAEKEGNAGRLLRSRAELERSAEQLDYFWVDGGSAAGLRLGEVAVAGKNSIAKVAAGNVLTARTIPDLDVSGGEAGKVRVVRGGHEPV